MPPSACYAIKHTSMAKKTQITLEEESATYFNNLKSHLISKVELTQREQESSALYSRIPFDLCLNV